MKDIIIYTDGACSGNPGKGGWACVLIYNEHIKEASGSEENTTNNRMELMAVIKAFQMLKEPCNVDIFSDSTYVVNAFNEKWLESWQLNGWKNSNKEPIKNIDLWQQLLDLIQVHNITWHKVKGHADDTYNNRCDFLARQEITKI